MSSCTFRKTLFAFIAFTCVSLILFVANTPAAAQSGALTTESAGFDTIGFIQAATIDRPIGTAGDLLSGGTIKVNDHVIIVPANSIVQMPAATLSWGQVFAQAPSQRKQVRHGIRPGASRLLGARRSGRWLHARHVGSARSGQHRSQCHLRSAHRSQHGPSLNIALLHRRLDFSFAAIVEFVLRIHHSNRLRERNHRGEWQSCHA